MHLRCISCDVLARPVYLCAAQSPHVVDIAFLRRGLHEDPLDLRTKLQAEIDATGPGYDAIVLAYGLCGGAAAGLTARDRPLVVPRAHDCITMFLGGRERYTAQFTSHPGTYWYVQDYLERDDGSSGAMLGVGAGTEEEWQAAYETFVEKYGVANADYLMEAMGAWQAHYDRAVLIDMGVGDAAVVEARAREQAARRGWAFERMAGDLVLLRRLLGGDWDRDFLVLGPGERLAMSYDEAVVRAE
jgi:Protein of unknown function (DUF1638)